MAQSDQGKRYTQARGRARRGALLQAARSLLHQREMDEITLPMISERAEIPASSTYHFFSDIRVLYKDLARTIADEMSLLEPDPIQFSQWRDCVAAFMQASASYFNSDAAARQLLLGPKTAPDIKQAACYEDRRFGVVLHSVLNKSYHLPQIHDPILTCFFAIQIADTFFSLSVLEHGFITGEMVEQATIGSTSYLANYLPPILVLRECASPLPDKTRKKRLPARTTASRVEAAS